MRKAIGSALIALGLAVSLGGAVAMSVSLGTIEARSALGEHVEARIPLHDVSPVRLAQLEVGLAPRRAFDRLGLERPPQLSWLDFRIVVEGPGAPYIEVTSQRPMDLPLLDFLVELRWPEGELVREYTLLLDRPLTLGDDAPPEVREPPAALAAVAEETPAPRARRATVYGPVREGDTLWSIARDHRPDDSVTVAQTMLAIQELNPEAFREDNVNALLTGWWLQLPTKEQATRISAGAAQAEYERQLRVWVPPGERPALVAEPPPPVAEPEPAPPRERPDARLEVLAPGEVGDDIVALLDEDAEPTREGFRALQRELAVARETEESLRAEKESLENRVNELTQRVADLERLLDLHMEGLLPAPEVTEPVPEPRPRPEPAPEPEPEMEPVPEREPTRPEPVREPEPPVDDEDEAPFWAEWTDWIDVSEWFDWSAWADRLPDNLLDPAALWDDMQHDNELRNQVLIAAGAGLLALSALLMLGRRRRRRRIEAERAHGLRLNPDDLEFDFDNMPVRETGDVATDPLLRAEEHIAEGDYRGARDVLVQGLEDEPHRADLRLKLLEVLAELEDRGGFAREAEALRDRVASERDPIWQAAAVIGRAFVPDMPLFADGGSGAGGQGGTADDELDEKPDLDSLDLGLEEEEDDEDYGAISEDDFERSLDEAFGAEDDTPEAEAPVDEPPASKEEDLGELAGDGLDEIDLDSLLDETEEEAPAAKPEPQSVEPEPAEEPEPQVAEPDEGEEGFTIDDDESPPLAPGEGDEVDTKLDLARAYIDLGDEAGARELLEEALEEGSSSQQANARKILEEIGA